MSYMSTTLTFREIMLKDTNKGRADFIGAMERFMMENGVKGRSTGVGCGRPQQPQRNPTSGNGLMADPMGSGSSSTMLVIGTKASLNAD